MMITEDVTSETMPDTLHLCTYLFMLMAAIFNSELIQAVRQMEPMMSQSSARSRNHCSPWIAPAEHERV